MWWISAAAAEGTGCAFVCVLLIDAFVCFFAHAFVGVCVFHLCGRVSFVYFRLKWPISRRWIVSWTA